MTSVLISGASVAGPTLAYWLRRHGFAPTLVERAPTPRPGGQAIDVRGVALVVADRMGLKAKIEAARTRFTGSSALDRDGTEAWRTTESTFSGGRFDAGDVELMKDDLTHLLVERTADEAEYLFSDHIVALDERDDRVDVTFASGVQRAFDLVVGADGLYSAVRAMTFGDDAGHIHHLGAYIAIFSCPNYLVLENWQIGIAGDTSRALVFPTRDSKELRVFASFESGPLGRDLTTDDIKALVAERCSELKWEMPKLFAAMREAPSLYFGAGAQVRMPHYTRGRIALVGDAGYCPSPMSGQGTSLALVGGYVLAAELARTPSDHAAAFVRYETRMRPFVEVNQALALRDRRQPLVEEVLERAKNAIALDA